MEKKMRKILGFLIGLALVLGLLPSMSLPAYASSYPDVTWSEDQTIDGDDVRLGTLTLGADVTVTISSWSWLYVYNGVNTNGHTLTVLGESYSSMQIYGAYPGRNGNTGLKGKIIVDSGSVVIGGADSETKTGGIGVEGNVVVNNGELEVRGGYSEATTGGVGVKGNVTVNGGTVTVKGGHSSASTSADGGVGIDGNITVNGGNAILMGGDPCNGGTAGQAISGTITGMAQETDNNINWTDVSGTTSTKQYVKIEPIPLDPVPYMAWDEDSKAVVAATEPCQSYKVVTGSTTAFEDGKWYVVSSTVEVANRIIVSGTANLILCDGYTLTAKKGIAVTGENTLNIFAQSDGDNMGKLIASDIVDERDSPSSGIGSNNESTSGIVYIHGGTIIANGGEYGAGIGGGDSGSAGSITIYGGEVTATGGRQGAGIGGGYNGAGGTVTINGGTVTATGGEDGAGIGGGGYSTGGIGGNVTINGGTVIATGVVGIGRGRYANDNGTLTLGTGMALYGDNDKNPPTTSRGKGSGAAYTGDRYKYMMVFYNPHTALTDETKPVISISRDGSAVTQGAPEIADVLTATTDATDLVYEWYRGDEKISGATETTYTVSDDDLGKTITVKVYQTKKEDGTDYEEDKRPTQTSAPTAPVEKKTNTATQITAAELTNSTTITDTSITVKPVMAGYEYTVVAKEAAPADNAWRSAEAGKEDDGLVFTGLLPGTEYDVLARAKGSDNTKPGEVTKITVTTDLTVTITGETAEGKKITASTTPSDPENVSYVWYSGDVQISGATSADYVIASTDVGKVLTVIAMKNAAKVGSASTATVISINEYIAGLTSPATIKLDGPIAGDIVIPENMDITLDLNGQEVAGGITAKEGSKLTIIDSSEGKTGTVKGIVSANTGNIIIKAGRYDKAPTATAPGTVTIEGGSFKENPADLLDDTYGVKEVTGTDYKYQVLPRATETTEPVAVKNLVYTGAEQALVSEAVAANGTMYYAVSKSSDTYPTFDAFSQAEIKNWTTSVPTAVEAGTYYVWYMAYGDDTHADSAVAKVENSIATATLTGGRVVFAGEDADGKLALEYTGLDQTVQVSAVVIGTGDEAVTITSDDFDVVISDESKVTGKQRGTYTVKVTGKNNCIGETSGQWEIVVGQPVITTVPVPSEITYGDYLSDSELTGGEAKVNGVKVEGTFSWKEDIIQPVVAQSGQEVFWVTFTPTDTENFAIAEKQIALTVNRAAAIETWLTLNITNEKTAGTEILNLLDSITDEDTYKSCKIENLDEKTEGIVTLASALVIPEIGAFEDGTLKYSLKEEVEPGSKCLLTVTFDCYNYEKHDIFIWLTAKSEIMSDDLVLENVEDQIYTGTRIKLPNLNVYSAGILLTEGVDYTVTYTKNTNVGTATVTVKGKGNYKGTQRDTFNIVPADISFDSEFSAADFYLKETGNAQKKAPVLKRNGKIVQKKNYTVKYCVEGTEAYDEKPEETTDFTKSYVILLTGTGNFEGTRAVKVVMSKDAVLLSKAKVSIDKKTYVLTQDAEGFIEEVEPKVTVTKGGTTYVEGDDYTVEYFDNYSIGKAYLIVTGKGTKLSGTKKISFTIKGTSISKATIGGVSDKTFDPTYYFGAPQTDYSLTLNGKALVEGDDYYVYYLNNTKVGTATMVFKGCGIYQGTKKVSYKITRAALIEGDPDLDDSFVDCAASAEYEKGGAKAEVTAMYKGEPLLEGVDYTVTYEKNKNVTTAADATATIKGKGNFKGTVVKNFKVTQAEIEDEDGSLVLTIADRTHKVKYDTKVSKFLKMPKVTQADTGKKLVKGTDYEKTATYYISDDAVNFIEITAADKNEVLNTYLRAKYPDLDYEAEGIFIKAEITLKGRYTGKYSVIYRVADNDISGAKTKITNQIYTGDLITFDPESESFSNVFIIYKGKNLSTGKQLVYGKDFVIDETSYKKNIKKGTASVKIIGVGNYSGTKTVKFKIVKKNL